MSHTIYFPTIMGGAGDTDDNVSQQERPEPRIPTGLNLGMPWQWEGDVRAKREMLGFPGWYDWHWASGGDTYQRMIWSNNVLENQQFSSNFMTYSRYWVQSLGPDSLIVILATSVFTKITLR